MKNEKNPNIPTTIICMGILFLFLCSIGVRFCVRQILVKKMGIENAFTHLVFWDAMAMGVAMDDTANVSRDIDWAEKYPFDTSTQPNATERQKESQQVSPVLGTYLLLVESIKDKVDTYSSELLAGQSHLARLYGTYNNNIGWKDIIGSNYDILCMENGFLTYGEQERTPDEITEIADSVLSFSDYLKEEGISFYYVNAGSKVNPNDKQLSTANRKQEFTNENGDALLAALAERNVNTLDMREYMIADGLDWYGSYYKTDHHWKTETGLWAAGVIADVLNERENFSFDPALFDPKSYEMTTYEDSFLGGQGRGLLLTDSEKDSYTRILPRFETELSVEIPTRDLFLTGSYKDTLFDRKNLENVLRYSEGEHFTKPDAYNSVAWRNDALGIVKNKNAGKNADKKILLLQDSFFWYAASYLACGAGETHMMYLSGFNGSLHAYVKEMRPDVVMVMYCERNIAPIDWSTHGSLFDFR